MSLYEDIFKTNGFDFPLKRKTSFFFRRNKYLDQNISDFFDILEETNPVF